MVARSVVSRIAVGLVVVAVAAGCDGTSRAQSADDPGAGATPSTSAPSASASPSPSLAAEPVTLEDAERCPATLPGAGGPPGVSPDDFFGWGASHGNRDLWVGGLWPDGVLAVGKGFIEDDGSVRMKFGWWRAVPGDLAITGRRLDGSAPPQRAEVPAGYGEDGFQATEVSFPTEGCWKVTGAVGSSTLSFVTFVIKQEP